MDVLTRIETCQHVRLPRAYRAFAERGYLTHPGDSYLWVHEAEWIPLAEVAEYEWPSYAQPKQGLVPFAFAGNGDLWCWNSSRMTGLKEPAIVYCPHDCYEGHWHAPSFIGWLYRLSLEYASSMWHDEAETKQNVRDWNALVREFGPAKWADDLDEVLARSPFEYEFGPRRMKERGLLTDKELAARVSRAFGADYVGAPFVWNSHGDPSGG